MTGLRGRAAVALMVAVLGLQVVSASIQLYERNVVEEGWGDLRYGWQMYSGRRG